MKRIFLIAVALLAGAGAAYSAGTRVIVIQPSDAVPRGATAIVMGYDAKALDSPDGICQRQNGRVTKDCRGQAEATVLSSTVLVTLPFNETLLRFSGAPYIAQ